MKTENLMFRAEIAQRVARELRLQAQFERANFQVQMYIRRYLSAMTPETPSFIEREAALETKRERR